VWTLFNRTGIVDLCGGEKNFLRSVEQALQATEKAKTFREYSERRASVPAPAGFTPDEGGPHPPAVRPDRSDHDLESS